MTLEAFLQTRSRSKRTVDDLRGERGVTTADLATLELGVEPAEQVDQLVERAATRALGTIGGVQLDLVGEDLVVAGGSERLEGALEEALVLLEDGLVKACQGLTSFEEIIRTLPRLANPRPIAELHRLQGVKK